tara:strand:- start:24581 stop:27169 length:2589 start_codon:yes stop_codon:yes gene_type:complete
MLSRILKITIPIILIGIILFISYKTYKKTQNSTNSPITVIPTNASAILQINDVSGLNRTLKISDIWKYLQDINKIKNINQEAEKISNFFSSNKKTFYTNQLFISLHKIGPNKHATLYCTTFKKENINNHNNLIKLFGNDISMSEYDKKTLYYNKSSKTYYSIAGDVLFFSKSRILLTDAIRTSNQNTDDLFVNPNFYSAYKTISTTKDINLMINYNNLFELINTITNKDSFISNFSEWAATDIRLKDNSLIASGLSTHNEEINQFSDILARQKSQKLNILDIIPEHTTQIFAITFKNQKKIFENKNQLLQNKNEFWSWEKKLKQLQDSCNVNYSDFIHETDNEAGMFNTSKDLDSKNTYTYFNTKESIKATSMIQGLITSSSIYKNYTINKVKDKNLTANLFGNIFSSETNYFTIINDYFIFGKSFASLEYVIDNFIANNTLSQNKSFKKINSYVSSSSNLFFFINTGKTAKKLISKMKNSDSLTYNPDSIIKFTSFTLQISSTKNGLIHNLCLFHDNEYKEAIKEEWYYPLDTNTSMNPQFVHNHFTKEKMILIQDNANNLIAINADGKKLWKKQIDSKINGSINYIDAYKNNKYQSLFNTNSHLHLIDRNGKYVESFPKKLPFSTQMGHSLFDYNQNKKYRIFIVGEDNILYNLNKKGEQVNGWKYTKSNNKIVRKPIHFTVEGKDFILNATNNTTTKLVARNGSDRVIFSNPHIFTNKVQISDLGELYAITNDKKLWVGKVDGSSMTYELPKLLTTSVVLSYNNGFYVTNKNSISYYNDTITKDITLNLDAQINSVSSFDKYIAIVTNSSLYLLKNNKIVKGFPINSEGLFNISDIDNDGKINIINIKKGFVYNYEIDS